MERNSLIKKGIAVSVIFLFVSVSVAQSIGINVTGNNTRIIPSETESTIPSTTIHNGSLSGYVNDTYMNPIEGALVRVYFHGTYEENYTDSSGYYHVSNIPLCWCVKNATASREGYKTEWVWLIIHENTTYDFVLTSINSPCYPVLTGTMGKNGWYVSCVEINFTTDDNVSTVYYSIDNGSWQTFDGVPIVVCDDGLHIFCWYYVDNEGNESDVECIYFKIDQTPSTIEILWEQIDLDIVFTAECNDATSGVDRVEFYVENELLYIDLEEPFTWIPAQPDIYPLKVIAYDNAGNNIDEIPPGNTPDFYHFIGFILPPEYSATCIRFRAVFVFYRWTITSPDGPVVIDWRPVIGRKTTHLLNHYIGSIGTFFIHATFNDGQY